MTYSLSSFFLAISIGLAPLGLSAVQVATLDGLPFPVDQDYYNGSDSAGGFIDAGVLFRNNFTDFGEFTSWDGFAYSRVNDTETPGFFNQYAAITGTDFSGKGTYAVAYVNEFASLSVQEPVTFGGFYVTNTTYAALSMQNGDDFSKKFGGLDGADPDFFRLSIQGYLLGNRVNALTFYLADFTSDKAADDYILTDWSWVDLSELGTVDELRFSLTSSDTGRFGMNTPAYFAMDNLTIVPEPSFYAALFGASALFLVLRRKR